MLIRIKNIQLLDNYVLRVSFDDNKTVIYDMKEDMDIQVITDYLEHININLLVKQQVKSQLLFMELVRKMLYLLLRE